MNNNKIKLFYDGFYFGQETYGGISRMWENTILGLFENFKEFEAIIYAPSCHNRALHTVIERLAGDCRLRVLKEKTIKPRWIFGNFRLRNLKLSWVLWKNRINNPHIFHSTLNTIPVFSAKIPVVITVHDLNLQLFPKVFKGAAGYRDFIEADRLSIQQSNVVIAVSENTRNDILKVYPKTDKNKVKVVYHGLNPSFLNIPFDKEGKMQKKYIFFVGGRNRYKNYILLLKAFMQIYKKYKDIELITVGIDTAQDILKEEASMVRENNLQNCVKDIGFVSDAKLVELYQNALVTVIPSLYEGFGFSLLEAMACYCPVIASDIPVFRELGKYYIDYFDSRSIDELVRLLEKHLTCEAELERLEEAYAYANGFTWSKSVAKIFEIYRGLQ